TRNLDNAYNRDNVAACERARRLWVKAASLRDQGLDGYEVKLAHDADAFPEPRWPKQTLAELIAATFGQRVINKPDHPGLKRLIRAKMSWGPAAELSPSTLNMRLKPATCRSRFAACGTRSTKISSTCTRSTNGGMISAASRRSNSIRTRSRSPIVHGRS